MFEHPAHPTTDKLPPFPIKFFIPEAGISKNHCATNSGSPEVELRFCPWIILFKY
jgi:hypothetical protein